ncbi:MAG: hypothetical protein WAU82_18860 [Candidatus Binatus sp.]|uniref:DUF2306 domain-containing protein n=1 Tax=Candidatus Binatus sp. TaxID=2811406 RepID=UPI003BB135AC
MFQTLSKTFGFEMPSGSPFFLDLLVIHILLGLACVVLGLAAMLATKRPRAHPRAGTLYYICLMLLFATASILAAMRWTEDYHLFILGALSFAAASVGPMARRQLWPRWIDFHVSGMGVSYILMLTAFYVDNGRNLPLWRDLPYIAYWIVPGAIGIPLIVSALARWHRRLGVGPFPVEVRQNATS